VLLENHKVIIIYQEVLVVCYILQIVVVLVVVVIVINRGSSIPVALKDVRIYEYVIRNKGRQNNMGDSRSGFRFSL